MDRYDKIRAYEEGHRKGHEEGYANGFVDGRDARPWLQKHPEAGIPLAPAIPGTLRKLSPLDLLKASEHAREWHESNACPECLSHLHRFLLAEKWKERQQFYGGLY